MKSRTYSAVRVNAVDMSRVLGGRDGQAAVVGVDVSKKDLKLMLRWADGSMARCWKAQNPGEIGEVIVLLSALARERGLRVALEPTGTYGDPLRQALARAGLATERVSSKASHDYAEIFDSVPSQHDGKDAAVVAELCAIGKGKLWKWEAPSTWDQELAEQVEEIDAQRRMCAFWCGKLEGLLARHWPESIQLLKVSSATLMRAMMQYGSPALLAADPRAKENLSRWSYRMLEEAKLAALLESAQSTVGVLMGEVDRRRVRRVAQRAWEAHLAGDRAARRLNALAKDHALIQRMGRAVGVPTACVLWVCLGDVRDYHCGEAYRKAMGLNLAERSSGRYQGRLKISKRGSSMVRRWMHMASLRQIRDHECVRQWYLRAKVRAEAHGALEHRSGSVAAITGVSRRLAKALYAVGAMGAEYNPRRLFPGCAKRVKSSMSKGGEAIAV